MKFKIEISETRWLVLDVEADSAEAAIEQTGKKYRNGEIVLSADNTDGDFSVKAL